MTEPLAQVHIVEQPDASRIVRIVGEIDTSNVDLIAAQLAEAANATNTLTIDLTAVTYLDSQAMRMLQQLADRHVEGSLHLTLLVEPADIGYTLLVITGIAQTVPIRPPSSSATRNRDELRSQDSMAQKVAATAPGKAAPGRSA